ncbi:hypothetical protein PR048_001707 [Dryococelus australis]|uniref:HAT C-terminal dimerisation domain-containing protein n=1 Tax=Dryococelus australis TaxID=614101 RepID=A0ABQ9IKK9_9NEOP|nr:hypothetical protein PR048_001707 [Dryococelus australis]
MQKCLVKLSNHREEGETNAFYKALLAVKLRYPQFAEAVLSCYWVPVNSVDAERFFSRYNLVVTDRRQN